MQTILQVEDDLNDVFFLKHAMKKLGIRNPLQVVTDGQQAIQYLSGVAQFADREQFPMPGLVLLDLKLPYVMGLDVLKWIREQPGGGPVVLILTASAETGDIASAYRLGANAFLTKPCQFSKFAEMVESINTFWLTHNMLAGQCCEQAAPAHWCRADPDAQLSSHPNGETALITSTRRT